MKKTLFIIASCVLAAVSCQKETAVENGIGSEGILTVTADIARFDTDTKTSIDGAAATITPVWSADDSIKLFNTNGDAFVYVVKSDGAGKSKAVFEPKGTAFTGTFACAYYPAANATSYTDGTGITATIPPTQVYAAPATPGANAGTFANGSFPMVGTGTLDASNGNLDLTFKNVFGLVQLNFTGNETIKEINLKSEKSLSGTATIATDENRNCTITNGKKYVTLTFEEPVTLDNSTATAFYIAVPADSTVSKVYVTTTSLLYKAKNIKASRSHIASLNSATLTSAGFAAVTYSEASTLTPQIINGTIWAPVNCGYVPKTGDSGDALGYPYGKLYQWGRKNGQGYYKASSGSTPTYQDATYPSGSQIANTFTGTNGTEDSQYFYKNNSKGNTNAAPYKNDWITNGSNTFWNLYEGTANPVSKNTSFDPCPAGWRVPTYDELEELATNRSSWISNDGQNGYYFSGSITYSASSPSIFLPAAGRNGCSDGKGYARSSYGYYWSSAVNNEKAWYLNFYSKNAYMYKDHRAHGCSVRCVQE